MKSVRLLLLVGFVLTTGAGAALSAHISQSPIDFSGNMGAANPNLLFGGYAAGFTWEATTTRSAMGKTESIKVTPKGAKPSLKWDGVQYELKDIHFHIHAEHTENGLINAMEMHIVHAKVNAPDTDPKKNLAIGRWIKEGNDNKLNPIFDNLPAVPALGANPSKKDVPGFAVHSVIPAPNNRSLYQYEGSLTTGLKEEVEGDGKLVSSTKVHWFMFKDPLLVPRPQIDKFRAHFQNGNWRETQDKIAAHMLKTGASVPEPGAVWLLAVGAVLAGGRMRRAFV